MNQAQAQAALDLLKDLVTLVHRLTVAVEQVADREAARQEKRQVAGVHGGGNLKKRY